MHVRVWVHVPLAQCVCDLADLVGVSWWTGEYVFSVILLVTDMLFWLASHSSSLKSLKQKSHSVPIFVSKRSSALVGFERASRIVLR